MDFGFFGMHIEAERTPIELGSPNVDQIHQGISERAMFQSHAELREFFCQFRRL
jgi:hypothetical protein